jgi:hypothetical protein
VHDEADGLRAHAERPPRRIVVGVHCANVKRPELDLVSLLDLDDALEAAAPHQDAGAARDDDAHRPVEPREGRQVEMVEVAVRDEDGVDIGERSTRHRPGSAQVYHGAPQDRVGEQARSVEADDDGAVAKPGERIVRRYADSSTRRFIPPG